MFALIFDDCAIAAPAGLRTTRERIATHEDAAVLQALLESRPDYRNGDAEHRACYSIRMCLGGMGLAPIPEATIAVITEGAGAGRIATITPQATGECECDACSDVDAVHPQCEIPAALSCRLCCAREAYERAQIDDHMRALRDEASGDGCSARTEGV